MSLTGVEHVFKGVSQLFPSALIEMGCSRDTPSINQRFPIGELPKSDPILEPKSSLDTSYRTKQNKIKKLANNVRFTSVGDIDKNTKKANIEALNFYIFKKIGDIKKALLLKTLNDVWGHGYKAYPEFWLKDIPIEVIIQYNKGIVNYKNSCLLNYAEKQFSHYIQSFDKTHGYLVLTNNITGDNGLKKIVTRYSDSYKDKIIKRMNWLMWKYGNENCCLLTLTIDPKKYNNDKFEMWEQIGKKYKRFIEKMKIWFKRHNREFPPYLFSVEAMFGRAENNYVSRGNPHLHSVFFNCSYFAPVEVIEKYWGQGFVKINSTAKNEKVRYPIHYVTKYITKTFTNNEPNNTLVQSLVWLFNKHSFDHSDGLVLPLYPKGSGEWSMDGIASINSGYHQIDEMIVIQDVIHSLFGGFKDPPPVHMNHVSHA